LGMWFICSWNYLQYQVLLAMVSNFHHKVDENFTSLGYYTASGGNSLPTRWDDQWVPSLWVKNPRRMRNGFLTLE
jgi:hypothetical protein